jgi:hypothetical protein
MSACECVCKSVLGEQTLTCIFAFPLNYPQGEKLETAGWRYKQLAETAVGVPIHDLAAVRLAVWGGGRALE